MSRSRHGRRLTWKAVAKHERSPAQTDYLEFEGRPHLFMAAEGWEEVAAAIDGWLDGVLEAPVAVAQGASAEASETER